MVSFAIYFLCRVNWENSIAQNSTIDSGIIITLANFTNSSHIDHFDAIQGRRNTYILTYVLLIAAVLYLVFQRALALYLLCLKASKQIHEKLLHCVIKAKMQFFHTNPSGRIINRFAKDLYDVDYYLALVLYDLAMVTCL